jgi:hypothetical protein
MPTNIELQGATTLKQVASLLIQRDMAKSKLLKLFPVVKYNETELVFERMQVAVGQQHARGDGGPTGPVPKRGVDQMKVVPSKFGDHFVITEDEFIGLREIGDISKFMADDKKISQAVVDMTDRYIVRLHTNIANMLMNGTYSVFDATGRERDRLIYSIPQYTPGTLFDDFAASTPMKYIRDLIPKLELGVSVNFRSGSILCSRPTANLVLNNANAADIFGKRREVGATFNSIDDVNKLLLANDLPQFEIVEDGYYPGPVQSGKPSNFTRFLTNGKMVLIGAREDGAPIGDYRLTRAAQNANSGPGEWYTVEDNRQRSPWGMILSMGHNGGPVPYYPEGIAVINAAASNSTAFN